MYINLDPEMTSNTSNVDSLAELLEGVSFEDEDLPDASLSAVYDAYDVDAGYVSSTRANYSTDSGAASPALSDTQSCSTLVPPPGLVEPVSEALPPGLTIPTVNSTAVVDLAAETSVADETIGVPSASYYATASVTIQLSGFSDQPEDYRMLPPPGLEAPPPGLERPAAVMLPPGLEVGAMTPSLGEAEVADTLPPPGLETPKLTMLPPGLEVPAAAAAEQPAAPERIYSRKQMLEIRAGLEDNGFSEEDFVFMDMEAIMGILNITVENCLSRRRDNANPNERQRPRRNRQRNDYNNNGRHQHNRNIENAVEMNNQVEAGMNHQWNWNVNVVENRPDNQWQAERNEWNVNEVDNRLQNDLPVGNDLHRNDEEDRPIGIVHEDNGNWTGQNWVEAQDQPRQNFDDREPFRLEQAQPINVRPAFPSAFGRRENNQTPNTDNRNNHDDDAFDRPHWRGRTFADELARRREMRRQFETNESPTPSTSSYVDNPEEPQMRNGERDSVQERRRYNDYDENLDWEREEHEERRRRRRGEEEERWREERRREEEEERERRRNIMEEERERRRRKEEEEEERRREERRREEEERERRRKARELEERIERNDEQAHENMKFAELERKRIAHNSRLARMKNADGSPCLPYLAEKYGQEIVHETQERSNTVNWFKGDEINFYHFDPVYNVAFAISEKEVIDLLKRGVFTPDSLFATKYGGFFRRLETILEFGVEGSVFNGLLESFRGITEKKLEIFKYESRLQQLKEIIASAERRNTARANNT